MTITVPDGLNDFWPETSIFPAILISSFNGLPITTLPVLLSTLLATKIPDEPILTEDLDKLFAVSAVENCSARKKASFAYETDSKLAD